MNRKGFTLIELIAVIIVLGIVAGITALSVLGSLDKSKGNTEDVFVATIKDAMDIYLNGNEAKNLSFESTGCQLKKSYGKRNIYKATINFKNVIDSEYKPITQNDLVNPADKDNACSDASTIEVRIYRDDDYVYYYSINRSAFGCLLKDTDKKISTLPSTVTPSGCVQ